MIDPDKKVAEEQRNRESLYQSNGHPEHFKSEGGEFIERTANREDIKNTMPEDIKNEEDAINHEKNNS